MSKSIQKFLKENLDKIIKIGIVYVVGFIIGMIVFNFFGIKEISLQKITNVLDLMKMENFKSISVLQNGLKNNFIFILLLYSSIITIICPLILLILMFLKGVLNGIYIESLITIFGALKGAKIVIGFGIIPCIISAFAFNIICINIMEIICARKQVISRGLKHLTILGICTCLLCFSIVIEQLMTSILLNGYTSI